MASNTQASQGCFNYDRADSVDPRITPVNCPKGTLYRFVPDSGSPVVLVKNDDGTSTNFSVVGSGTGSGNIKVEYRTITAPEAAAQELTLAQTPINTNEVALDTIKGCAQFFGTDFTVSGAVLSWAGGPLATELTTGDKLRIFYAY